MSIWVLLDRSNGGACYDKESHNYTFWFFTRQAARDFLADHNERKSKGANLSDLVGPYLYRLTGK